MPELSWKLDVGNLLTILVLLCGLAAGYGSLSARLTMVESQAAKAVSVTEQLDVTLRSLEIAITRVNAQMDEREKRFDHAQTVAAVRPVVGVRHDGKPPVGGQCQADGIRPHDSALAGRIYDAARRQNRRERVPGTQRTSGA